MSFIEVFLNITTKIERNEAKWSDLFEKLSFFDLYSTYLLITSRAEEKNQKKWGPYVESRLRVIIPKLEMTTGIDYAHPFTEPFNFIERDKSCTAFLIGLKFQKSKLSTKQIDLSIPVLEFRKTVEEWVNKTPDMEILISPVKQSELPDFVFEGGIRPSPVKKNRKKSSNNNVDTPEISGTNKRLRSSEGDIEENDTKRFKADKSEPTTTTTVDTTPKQEEGELIGTTVTEPSTSHVVEQSTKNFVMQKSGPILDGSDLMQRKSVNRSLFGQITVQFLEKNS